MNPRTFLQEFEESTERERLVNEVYDEMVEFCHDENITENDVSTETIEQLAEGFVERGFGVPPSSATMQARTEWYTDGFNG